MQKVPFEVACGPEGRLYIAAEHVTAMLRAVAQSWVVQAEAVGAQAQAPAGAEGGSVDGVTLLAAADTLTLHADDLDIQLILLRGCIAPE
ncbi:hypothetical protein ACWIG3_09805 [Streptomyces celluloflavus]|uniref:hypothetical protein n=1 Tax=Streptomyces celluloflavus TaxID=58344 RepID=UPI00368BFABA